MPVKNHQRNPIAFIAIGVCFMGAGVALSAALHSRGVSAVGIGIIGVGVAFLIIGVAQKRKLESGKSAGDEKDRPGL
jgi:mannose/fructose/N-acetylgalactosamine-specific phosphotransferase system component IIC